MSTLSSTPNVGMLSIQVM